VGAQASDTIASVLGMVFFKAIDNSQKKYSEKIIINKNV